MNHRETFAQALSDILVKHKVITAADSRAMHRAFKDSGKEQFDDFLLEEGLVEEAALLRALAEHYQVPAIDVVGYFFDHELLRNFPKEFLVENRIIPLEIDGAILVMVASIPNDSNVLVSIGKYSSADVQFRVGLARDIIDAIREYYDPSITEMQNEDYDSEVEHDEKESYREMMREEEEISIQDEEKE